ncbi:MAG: type II toxin-antitoxin system RelE/ParE family toxin [Fibrobacterota bacterium]
MHLLIKFKNKKLKKCYTTHKNAVKTYGADVARKYIQRINLIKNAEGIDEVMKLPGLRCHPLKGNRNGQYAVKLTGFYRLIFKLENNVLNIALIEEVSKHYDN